MRYLFLSLLSLSRQFCKHYERTSNIEGPMQALTIDQSSNIVVNGLTVKNSQQMHFTISRSESVRIFNVVVSAPGDSPNTDGIHLTSAKNVVIQNTKIGTGSYISFLFLYIISCSVRIQDNYSVVKGYTVHFNLEVK